MSTAPLGDRTYMKRLAIYWHIWHTIAAYTLQETFLNRWTNLLFFTGKGIRYGMSLFFLFLLQKNLNGFAGYSSDQVIVFFLTYQFMDTLAQVFFRGVYLFSWQVRSGELDFYLSKPLNPLFRILTGKPDMIDACFLLPSTAISLWILSRLHLHITPASIAIYCALLLNSFLIAMAFHIFVICLGVLTTEVDNAIMLYRDTTALSRFPIDMYREPLRTVLYFVFPIGLMNTIPAQILMNTQPSYTILTTCVIGITFFLFSLLAWKESIKRYTSAGG